MNYSINHKGESVDEDGNVGEVFDHASHTPEKVVYQKGKGLVEYVTKVWDDEALRPKKSRKRRRPRLLALSRLPLWIRNGVEQFRADHLEYGDPDDAKNECTWSSEKFLELLCLEYPQYMEAERWGTQEVTNDRAYKKFCTNGIFHDVARVGNILIDWTARQFHPNMAFPRIWRQSWFLDPMRDPQLSTHPTSIAFYKDNR